MNSHLRIYTFKIKVLVLCQFMRVDSQNYNCNLQEPSLKKKYGMPWLKKVLESLV